MGLERGSMGRVEGAVQPEDEEMEQELIAIFNYPKEGAIRTEEPGSSRGYPVKGHEAPSHLIYSVAIEIK